MAPLESRRARAGPGLAPVGQNLKYGRINHSIASYFGMLRGFALSVLVPVLLLVAVLAISRTPSENSNIELASKAEVHKLAKAKSSGLLGDYENWKTKKDTKSADGLILEEPKLNDALSGLTKLKVKKGSKKAAALLKAQAELRKVLEETASDQQLGRSAIEGTE